MATAVSVRDVYKDYRLGRQVVAALRGVSLEIQQGEFTVIAGPSGSGKSTLLNLIGCMDVASRGEVLVDGEATSALSERRLTEFRLKNLGYVFQTFNLVPVLTVAQNIELPLLLRGGLSKQERRARVHALAETVGLGAHLKHRPRELSGGQQQRVAIARALVGHPKLVLADEPTANLDSTTGGQIIGLMREMARTEHSTFIFSTHDPRVMERADRIIEIADGKVVAERTNPPQASKARPH